MKTSLKEDVENSYEKLVKIIDSIPTSKRGFKSIEGITGKISLSDLIAYQIGWGQCLIRWYEAGICGQQPEMPGDGFLKWDYVSIANHFYHKYSYDASVVQMKIFHETVVKILEFTQKENDTGCLDQEGVWSWCTLSSGKKWPLSKWIKVNTVSPYKRAVQLIKKAKYI